MKRLAALAVLALYNGEDTNKAFKGKRRASLLRWPSLA